MLHTNAVFVIGTIALAICGLWWAYFYLDVLSAAGQLMTSKDWADGFALYGGCAFWDEAHCLAAKAGPKFAGHVHYQPFAVWFVLGMLASAAIIRVQQAVSAVRAR